MYRRFILLKIFVSTFAFVKIEKVFTMIKKIEYFDSSPPVPQSFASNCNNFFFKKSGVFIFRAGHTTTLPRQRDHVCWLLHFYYIRCGFTIQTPSSENVSNFLLSLKLLNIRCRVAVIAKLNICRVPISGYHKQLQVLVVEMKFSGDKTRSLFSSTSLILLGMLVTPAVLSSAYYQLFPAGI